MDSKELSIEASERELLQIEIASNQERNENGEIENKIGEELKDRKVGDKWKILVTENEIYGTNWYYVSKGTNFESNQKLENNYVINYETGEVKKVRDVKKLMDIGGIEDDKCDILLTSEDSVGVLDGLLLNFDPKAVTDGVTNNQKDIEEVMGNDVTLYNFDYNQESGFYDGCLWLDGVNDYITVECGTDKDKQEMIENGFTVEFTGIIEEGASYSKKNGIYDMASSGFGGLLFYGDHSRENFSDFRFYIRDSRQSIGWSVNGGSRGQSAASDFSLSYNRHNVIYPFSFVTVGEEFSNFVITLNPKILKECENETGRCNDGTTFLKTGYYMEASLWSKGELVLDSDFAVAQWDTFSNNTIYDCFEFVIGYFYTSDAWGTGPCFSKMKLNSLRVYKRALDGTEIAENWNVDELYRRIMDYEN